MLVLLEEFSQKCLELRQALLEGRDDLVRIIDSEINPLVNGILDYRARNTGEIHMQLQFLSSLIREDSNDPSSVVRHSATLSMLLDRYFCGYSSADIARRLPPETSGEQADHEYRPLSDAIADSLPHRVAVLTPDYRYLYSNAVNASHLGEKALLLTGRHVRDFTGDERFENEVRGRLDRCFAGETIEYTRNSRSSETQGAVRCWMRPLTSERKRTIFAALIVMDHTDQPGI